MKLLRTPWERAAFDAGLCAGVLLLAVLEGVAIVVFGLLEAIVKWP